MLLLFLQEVFNLCMRTAQRPTRIGGLQGIHHDGTADASSRNSGSDELITSAKLSSKDYSLACVVNLFVCCQSAFLVTHVVCRFVCLSGSWQESYRLAKTQWNSMEWPQAMIQQNQLMSPFVWAKVVYSNSKSLPDNIGLNLIPNHETDFSSTEGLNLNFLTIQQLARKKRKQSIHILSNDRRFDNLCNMVCRIFDLSNSRNCSREQNSKNNINKISHVSNVFFILFWFHLQDPLSVCRTILKIGKRFKNYEIW